MAPNRCKHAKYLSQNIGLHVWGLGTPNSMVTRAEVGFEVNTLTTSWTWIRKGNQVRVDATITSQPDWHDSLEIEFRDAKSSGVWFAYLMNYAIHGLPGKHCQFVSQMRRFQFDWLASLPPRAEHVIVRKTRVSWMHKSDSSIQMRTGVCMR
jgi:hypothetical protein